MTSPFPPDRWTAHHPTKCGADEIRADHMTDADVIAAIRQTHLPVNVGWYERHTDYLVQWDAATVDRGGTIYGPGPYLKVPVSYRGDDIVIRVYAPAKLRRRLAKQWKPHS